MIFLSRQNKSWIKRKSNPLRQQSWQNRDYHYIYTSRYYVHLSFMSSTIFYEQRQVHKICKLLKAVNANILSEEAASKQKWILLLKWMAKHTLDITRYKLRYKNSSITFVSYFLARFWFVFSDDLPLALGGRPTVLSATSAKSFSSTKYARPNCWAGNRPSLIRTLTRVRCKPNFSATCAVVSNFIKPFIQHNKLSVNVDNFLDKLSTLIDNYLHSKLVLWKQSAKRSGWYWRNNSEGGDERKATMSKTLTRQQHSKRNHQQ